MWKWHLLPNCICHLILHASTPTTYMNLTHNTPSIWHLIPPCTDTCYMHAQTSPSNTYISHAYDSLERTASHSSEGKSYKREFCNRDRFFSLSIHSPSSSWARGVLCYRSGMLLDLYKAKLRKLLLPYVSSWPRLKAGTLLDCLWLGLQPFQVVQSWQLATTMSFVYVLIVVGIYNLCDQFFMCLIMVIVHKIHYKVHLIHSLFCWCFIFEK